MATGSFVSIKGGTGKTCILICVANYLAACGYRVLAIDTDLNNSLSLYYPDGDGFVRVKTVNIAAALSKEENDLVAYAVKTRREGVDLIASTPYLSDLRSMPEKRLSRMTGSLEGRYDVVLIDCHPTYDNIVLNAVHASDYLVTPVLQDTFSYNGTAFMRKVIGLDTDKGGDWYVLMNGYNRRYTEARGGMQKEVERLYFEQGFPLTPRSTWLPWTAAMRRIVDNREMLTDDLRRLTGGRARRVCEGVLMGSFSDGAKHAGAIFAVKKFSRILKIDEIETAPDIRRIFTQNEELVEEIAGRMRATGYDKAFPIVVWKRDGKLVVVEGHTRLLAAIRAGLTEIPVCERKFESREEALLYTYRCQKLRRNLTQAEILNIANVMCNKSGRDGSGRVAENAALQKNTPDVTITGVYRKLKEIRGSEGAGTRRAAAGGVRIGERRAAGRALRRYRRNCRIRAAAGIRKGGVPGRAGRGFRQMQECKAACADKGTCGGAEGA